MFNTLDGAEFEECETNATLALTPTEVKSITLWLIKHPHSPIIIHTAAIVVRLCDTHHALLSEAGALNALTGHRQAD